MDLHQLRRERVNLQKFLSGSLFSEPLSAAEQATILSLWRSARHLPANKNIEASEGVQLITSGWAGWLRYAQDGRRLIFLFLMPGDFIVPSLFTPESCDLVSLTPMRTVDASDLVSGARPDLSQIATLIADSGRYYRSLLIDHMTRLTSGSTTRGVAHLLSEFYLRSIRAGTIEDQRFSLPVGQRTLARALGRSPVQINKVINQFQAGGLLKVGYDWVEMRDPTALQTLSGLTSSLTRQPSPSAGARDAAAGLELVELSALVGHQAEHSSTCFLDGDGNLSPANTLPRSSCSAGDTAQVALREVPSLISPASRLITSSS